MSQCKWCGRQNEGNAGDYYHQKGCEARHLREMIRGTDDPIELNKLRKRLEMASTLETDMGMDDIDGRALIDWANEHELDKRSALLIVLRGMEGRRQSLKRAIEKIEKRIVRIEEEMEKIEDGAGLELPEEQPQGIMQYVEGAVK